MNTSRPTKDRKTIGQAMVEFALALPILLTLLYGLLETGRLLFIYASTVTAARQAVRYGSATGDSPNGMPYYQDCDGIEAAANNVGFINTFESITIAYDAGLDSSNGNPLDLTPADPACGDYTDEDVQNGHRIIVEVTAQWQPIVPIVPLEPFTITSQSERTILASVSISVTSVPQGWQNSGNGILTLSISVAPTTYSTVGQTITYTYTLKNTGSGDLSAPFTVTNTITGYSPVTFTCAGAPATLASGGSFNCIGTYQIIQADLDAGSVTNTATASANGSPSNTVSKTITANAAPALSLSKSASPTASSTVGAIITYTYTLTNTGNVSLTSPYAVADNKIASVNCSGAASPLAPTASTTCTASYSITNNDITNGSVVNQAAGTAKFKTTTITSNNATATVLTPPLVLAISVSPLTATLPNQVITYTFSVLNNSAFTANSLSVTDSRITVTCPSTTLAAGSTINCTGTYTVTQADLDAGGTISNSAQAAANNGSPISSNTVTASVAISQTPALSATVSGSPAQPVPPDTTLPANTTIITYTYTLTNTGNVTLSSPFSVTDNKTTITCSDQASMAPAATKTCTGTYPITAADESAGSVINTGTASAVFGAQTITSSPASFTVITYSGARFNLVTTQNKNTPITPADLTISYTYTLTNTGGVTLSKPYTISSSLQSTLLIAGTGGSDTPTTTSFSPDCTSAAASIAPGISTNCIYTHTHPSGTGSSTLENSTLTASIGGTPVTSLPGPLTATVYNCTTSNFAVGSLSTNNKIVTWAITNTVGITLPISSISINWANSGSGASYWELKGVSLNNSSSLTTGTLPDISSPYSSGSGMLTGSSSAASMTTITFEFSKNNPTGLSASITMASPYGNCSR
ncbi:MAG: TadE/TadG family type IV pilus assembly protein [Anaerolineales bacterium]|nr:TadE/TadG family type IV pilus assembly protein [Anaerolineales bacterium]